MKNLPNILTGARLALSLIMFVALCWAAGALPYVEPPQARFSNALITLSLACFIIAAVTDFFDGWLARKYDVVSVAGAILDPIADKILVCGAIVGLIALGAKDVALPGGLILFREFAVSALREVLAPRGVKLPVTFLAKAKTTLQLVALGAIMSIPAIASMVVSRARVEEFAVLRWFMTGSYLLLWLAALVTVWTGIEYAMAARKALATPRTAA